MTRRINIFTTAALALSCALPVSGALAMHESGAGEASQESAPTYRDLRSPDARDAAREVSPVQVTYRDLRSPDARDAARAVSPVEVTYRDLRSPDARDAARAVSPVEVTYRDLRSPDARDAARAVSPVEVTYRDLRSPDARDVTSHPAPAPLVATVAAEPADGFDFGDAGIGAAALLGLFGLGFGSTLILTKGRRQQQVTAHATAARSGGGERRRPRDRAPQEQPARGRLLWRSGPKRAATVVPGGHAGPLGGKAAGLGVWRPPRRATSDCGARRTRRSARA